jgi:hypothetical protein
MSTAAHAISPDSFAEFASRSRRVHIRRRTTPTQGGALEMLGHAVEYLADSRPVRRGR